MNHPAIQTLYVLYQKKAPPGRFLKTIFKSFQKPITKYRALPTQFGLKSKNTQDGEPLHFPVNLTDHRDSDGLFRCSRQEKNRTGRGNTQHWSRLTCHLPPVRVINNKSREKSAPGRITTFAADNPYPCFHGFGVPFQLNQQGAPVTVIRLHRGRSQANRHPDPPIKQQAGFDPGIQMCMVQPDSRFHGSGVCLSRFFCASLCWKGTGCLPHGMPDISGFTFVLNKIMGNNQSDRCIFPTRRKTA